jgi:hypothetical protein
MLLLFSLFLVPCAPSELACTCIQRPEPHTVAEARASLAGTAVVFTGHVLHTGYRHDSTRVVTTEGDSVWFRSTTLIATMALEKVWKGQARDTVRVETEAQTTACGASLQSGEEYLIDAAPVSDSVFTTSKCGWTRPLSRAAKLQALLRRVIPVLPPRPA